MVEGGAPGPGPDAAVLHRRAVRRRGAVPLVDGCEPGDVGLTTLFVASKLPLSDPRLLYVPWSWCVTAALTFLPVGVTLLAFMSRFSTKQSLHGDARFANERELRLFEYRGEYQ